MKRERMAAFLTTREDTFVLENEKELLTLA